MPAGAAEAFPLADAMFKALGEQLDAGDAERKLFGQSEDKLWTGGWIDPQSGGNLKSPLFARQRLERLISKTNDVRRTYQARLADEGKISDKDFNRSLSDPETTLVHNAWMNDVSSWMHKECLDQYMGLLSQESTKGKGKGSAGKPSSRAGKGSAGKPASSAGKGSAGKVSARQQAQQLKKQRFNKVINDIARSKTVFMSFVRHPCMQTPDGFGLLLTELEDYKKSFAYQEMVKQSEKRTEERTDARFRLRRGQRDANQNRDTELAKSFRTGDLAMECAAAEAEYSTRKRRGP